MFVLQVHRSTKAQTGRSSRYSRPLCRAALLAGLISLAGACLAFDAGPFVTDALVLPVLERRFDGVATDLQSATGLIVLGGNVERLQEAGQLARRYPHLRIFASGAGTRGFVTAALGQGIAPRRIQLETQSTTTYENGVFTKAYLAPAPHEHWLLVTSASHMARAMGVFRALGMDVDPMPVFDDPADRASRVQIAQHEVFGLAYYWLLGRSSGLFPGPEHVGNRVEQVAAREADSPAS